MATRTKASVVIVGGGLSGLVAAAYLEKAGVDYHLIDAQPDLGGLIRGQEEHATWLDYGMKSLPAGAELSQNPLLQLKNDLGLNIQIESWTETPKTYEDKGLTDFVGFGETKDRILVEELAYYTQSPRLLVSGGWQKLVDELVARIPERRRWSQGHITKFEVEDDMIVAANVNGDHRIAGKTWIFTLSPATLSTLLPQGAVSPKLLQRIARTTPFTAISLDLATDRRITDAKNVFVFKDTPKDEDPFYVVGSFITNIDPLRQAAGAQISTWMSFIHPEAVEDDETVSKIIKTMKKLIKKAFPEAVDGKKWERLMVVPQAIANFEQLTLEKNGTLPGLTNFWMAGGQLPGELRNTGAAIATAKLAAEKVAAAVATLKADAEGVEEPSAGTAAATDAKQTEMDIADDAAQTLIAEGPAEL